MLFALDLPTHSLTDCSSVLLMARSVVGVVAIPCKRFLSSSHTYHSVLYQNILIGLLYKFLKLADSLIGLLVGCQSLFAVPLGGFALLACGNGGAFSVYGDTAENGGLAVCLYFLSVDVKQYLELLVSDKTFCVFISF